MWDDSAYYGDDYWSSWGENVPTAIDDQQQQPQVSGDDLNWWENDDGTWVNTRTGEVQDEFGNTLDWLQPTGQGEDGAPLFADPNSGLQPRDGNQGGAIDAFTPVAVNTGPGFFGAIGNFLSGAFNFLTGAGGNPSGMSGAGGGGFGSGGGGGMSSNQNPNQSTQQYQQAIQQLQAQLAAAQRANASPAVVQALQRQLASAGGGGGLLGGIDAKTLLLVGGVLAVGYFLATRNRPAA